jgi:hypothetical protein
MKHEQKNAVLKSLYEQRRALDHIYKQVESIEIEQPPIPKSKKIIDLQPVIDNKIPMLFDGNRLGFLSRVNPKSAYPYLACTGLAASKIKFSDQWIPNIKGIKPWPEGVLVTILFRDGILSPIHRLEKILYWTIENHCPDDIIASRFHSIQDGWELPE